MMVKVGVIAFQGDVREHILALAEAGRKTGMGEKVGESGGKGEERSGLGLEIVEVRKKKDLEGLDGLVIPGGESTTLSRLIWAEGMEGGIKKIRKILGTCAGAILLAKKVKGAEAGQSFLGLMDLEVSRNAYGPQADSFEKELETELGKVRAVFIRAPVFEKAGKGCRVLAELNGKAVAVEEKVGKQIFLALAFHPEIAGETKFHEYFLKI